MISKELLSEVINDKVSRIGSIDFGNHIPYELSCGNTERINIYELIHKCKEWAYNEGYEIEVTSGKKCSLMMRSKIPNTWTECFGGAFNSEYEAVVKACEWIIWENS